MLSGDLWSLTRSNGRVVCAPFQPRGLTPPIYCTSRVVVRPDQRLLANKVLSSTVLGDIKAVHRPRPTHTRLLPAYKYMQVNRSVQLVKCRHWPEVQEFVLMFLSVLGVLGWRQLEKNTGMNRLIIRWLKVIVNKTDVDKVLLYTYAQSVRPIDGCLSFNVQSDIHTMQRCTVCRRWLYSGTRI